MTLLATSTTATQHQSKDLDRALGLKRAKNAYEGSVDQTYTRLAFKLTAFELPAEMDAEEASGLARLYGQSKQLRGGM